MGWLKGCCLCEIGIEEIGTSWNFSTLARVPVVLLGHFEWLSARGSINPLSHSAPLRRHRGLFSDDRSTSLFAPSFTRRRNKNIIINTTTIFKQSTHQKGTFDDDLHTSLTLSKSRYDVISTVSDNKRSECIGIHWRSCGGNEISKEQFKTKANE